MTDEVNYAIPYGWLGRVANRLLVEREVNAIFDYRFKWLEKHFKNSESTIKKSA